MKHIIHCGKLAMHSVGLYPALTEEEVEYHGLTSPGVANKVLEEAHQPRLERGQSVSK